MNGSASTVMERIRGLVLSGSPARSEVAAVEDLLDAEVRRVNAELARCHAWIVQGLTSEAISLANGLDLTRRAATLQLEGLHEPWNRLLQAAGLGAAPRVDLELLDTLVAAAGRHESMSGPLSAMRLAALRRAPLAERLATLRALVDREPRQPAWLEGVRRLEREAAAAIVERAREVSRGGDRNAAMELIRLEASLSLRVEDPSGSLQVVRQLADAAAAQAVRERVAAMADALHAAAATMDIGELERLGRAWTELAAQGSVDASMAESVRGPLDLLARQRAANEGERARRRAVEALELALDRAAPMVELERLADAAVRAEAVLPAAVALRLADRRRSSAATQARRRSLVVVAVLAVAAVTAWMGWMGWTWWRREAEVSQAIAETDRAIEAQDWTVVDAVMQQAAAADPLLMRRAAWQALQERARVARSTHAERVAAAELLLDESRALADGSDAAAMEAKALQILSRLESLPPSSHEQLSAAAAQLRGAAATVRERAAGQARAGLVALEAELASVADPEASPATRFDPMAWRAVAERCDGIAERARGAAAEAARSPDARTASESLQAIATQAAARGTMARERAARIELVVDTLKQLERFEADEQATLDRWQRLLTQGGDILAARGMLASCEAGRDAAIAGVGVRAWRTAAVPALIAGRADLGRRADEMDWGDAATARTIEAVVTAHLDAHPSSPHAEAAATFRGLARRTVAGVGSQPSLGAAAAESLVAMGYARLVEQPFEGGRTLYRRSVSGSTDAWGHAIERKQDLSLDAGSLRRRTPPPFRATGSARPWPASKAFEEAMEALPGCDGRAARDGWLRMLQALRASASGDPVLHWHATRDAWREWLRLFADESDPEDAAAARWVRSLDAVAMLTAEDPIMIGAGESNARAETVRRAAREQLSRSFDPARLTSAAARRDARMAEGLRPASPAAVGLPSDAQRLRVEGLPQGAAGLVPVRRGDLWTWAPLRVEGGQAAWADAVPPVTWPQTVFMQGGMP
jgi:hypothetical protein